MSRPGFAFWRIFRWLDSMDPAAARHIAEIMDRSAGEKGRLGHARDA